VALKSKVICPSFVHRETFRTVARYLGFRIAKLRLKIYILVNRDLTKEVSGVIRSAAGRQCRRAMATL